MNEVVLPENSTPASQRRAELALRLAQTCPPELADEIALVGSVAHGVADDESDLELNLWAEATPPLAARLAWLQAAGATDVHAEDAPRPDDSYWIGFTLEGISGEVGWQTYTACDEALEFVLSGKADRKALVFADILTSALPLRIAGRLAAWQARLSGYSDAVLAAIIAEALARWSRPDAFASARRLAQREERIALTALLVDDLDMALRVLYAAHRRWEPSRKWTLTLARRFAPDVPARLDAILCDPSLERRVELCARFCLDALKLTPAGALLIMLLPRLQAVLGSKLVGVYLFGSLVMGDFDDISDIDLLVALTDDLTDAEFAALDALHRELVAAYPDWDDRIELLYLSVAGLQSFKTQRSPIAVISPGEPFHRTDAGADWLLNWYIVREKGVTLIGAPPQTIIPPISRAEYVQNVRDYVATKREIDDSTTRPGQAYVILTLCRALYTVTYGEPLSKRKAAAWAAEQLPEWAATIHNALLWREQWKDKNVDPTATLENTRRFAQFMSAKILEQPPL
jgi:predicted nucleotidyltransferase